MTYNIKLRRFEYEDAQALADFCNDEDLQRYLLLCRLPYTVDDAHAFIKYAKDCQKSGGEQCFAITLDDNVIGCISYTIQSSGEREYFKLKLLVSEFFSKAKNREDGLYRPLCFWCTQQELNLHGSLHKILSLARLPIPP